MGLNYDEISLLIQFKVHCSDVNKIQLMKTGEKVDLESVSKVMTQHHKNTKTDLLNVTFISNQQAADFNNTP